MAIPESYRHTKKMNFILLKQEAAGEPVAIKAEGTEKG